MEPARATWTDERLDDLADRMDRGFERVDRDIWELRAEMRSEFGTVRDEMRSGDNSIRAEMNARFDNVERTLHRFGGGMILTFAAGFISLLLTGG